MNRYIAEINKTKYEVKENETVLSFLQKEGFFLFSLCGGKGSCGKCQVRVSGSFRSKADNRINFFDNEEISACRYLFASDCIISLSEKADMNIESGLSRIKANGQNCLAGAVDIGTTTIVLALYQLSDGRMINEVKERNCQIVYGSDIISRIEFTTHPGNIELIREKTVAQIREMFKKAVGDDKRKISKVVISANTVMLHFLKGLSAESIATAPYMADNLFGYSETVNDTEIYYAPCISAYAGADIFCGLNYLKPKEKNWLFIDIGTNGEIVLNDNGNLLCTSAAAGPAFEGAEISCGMDGSTGAIDQVYMRNNEICCHVIGETEAEGICGSGLIDAVSIFLNNGIISRNGRFVSESRFKERIRIVNNKKCFFLTENVYIGQDDIRQFQLAKSAIATAIQMLLQASSSELDRLERVYIAGGFGQYINIDNAKKTGLLPDFDNNIIEIKGNTALKGAATLISEQPEDRYREITYYSLADESSFSSIFVKNLNF